SREKDAITVIERLGGNIRRDEDKPGRPVVEVDLLIRAVTDNDLPLLSALPDLESLNLGITPVTDAGFKHLGRLPKLRRLVLFGTRITDGGLKDQPFQRGHPAW